MADKPTQKNRELAIETPLGEDALLLISMSGTERLGRPFEYRLELASQNGKIKAEKIVGQNVTVRLELGGGRTRFFNGQVNHFTQLTTGGKLARYRATVVPWLWFLSRTGNCRIFQEKTVPDIIKQVFRDRGFTNFEDGLSGSYQTREYCVQYRETEFNFVNRLMEQEGIYYYFKHENGKHSLVLADSYSAHDPYPELDKLIYQPADTGSTAKEYVSDWSFETHLQPVSYALNDFDFKNSKNDLQARAKIDREHKAADFEMYDYPGDYVKTKDGEEYARKRIEEIQAEYEVATAKSDSRGVCTGFLFSLADHPRDDQNKEHLITSANYTIKGDEIFSASTGGSEFAYSCEFTSIKSSQPFRSPRITPKPSISGPQTAIVVGPSGDEVYTDEHARVKVKFHWDRYSKADENSSCWIRVAQVWAGGKWGAMYIPRIGQEVIVEFLEGDPDRPIITGRVYNGQSKPPYDLPGNKTISTLKSNSSKGGDGFNEIRFEDKKDEEQIYIHAQKNLDVRIGNDRFETVEGDRHLVVENEKFEQVKSHRNEFVELNHLEEIGQDRNLSVKGKEAKEVENSLSLTVKGDVIEAFSADHSEQTTGDYYLKAKNVVIEATQNITLSVGSSYIAIEKTGIEITSGALVKVQGKTVGINGDMATEIKGGVVKIN
jgi:type VI secretion system secreted protein VgrG